MKVIITNLLLIVAMTAVTMAPAHAQNLSNEEREKMVENVAQADANSDGMLNRSEFETLINLNAADDLGRAAKIKRAGLYNKAFKRLDANSDGVITKEEMQAIATQKKS